MFYGIKSKISLFSFKWELGLILKKKKEQRSVKSNKKKNNVKIVLKTVEKFWKKKSLTRNQE